MGSYTVWAKSECPYCQRAQALLLEKKLPHNIVLVDQEQDILQEVQQKFNWPTVPVIVEKRNDIEIFVGGFTDLVEYLERK
jgi:glutaredoxin|tara:strand:- start:186 stop:428 length:243 start_codon:yes stop_codon:yes gene_type:complete